MLKIRQNTFISIWVVVVMVLMNSGCQGTAQTSAHEPSTGNPANSSTSIPSFTLEYKVYEIQPEDVRYTMGTMKFPRFSLEYPDSFGLVDINEDEAPHFNSEYISVYFGETQRTLKIPNSEIQIIAQKPGFRDTNNAIEENQRWLEIARKYSKTNTTRLVEVDGISAQYSRFTTFIPDSGNYKPYSDSTRIVIFDFEDLIWTIQMIWCYAEGEEEPPGADACFSHIIESFKFQK
jgi:hypothetical protein